MTNKHYDLDNRKVRDEKEDKIISTSYTPKPLLVFGLVLLLITVGTISFLHADGWQVLRSSWLGVIIPSFTLEIIPETTFIPADGSTQIYIDTIAKNKNGQLLDGEDISVNVTQGEIDITNALQVPIGVSKRIIIQAPFQPQTVTLTFNLKNTCETLNLEVFDLTPPTAPILKIPIDKTIFSTATPTFSGESNPQTKVEIYVDDRFNTLAEVDNTGLFNTQLQQAISRGIHKVTIVAINKYNVRSNVSPPIHIEIQTLDPEIDVDNIRIKPNPAKVNEALYIFIPASANTQSVVIVLDNKEYPLKDTYGSSIFSGTLLAPSTPGLYRISVIITTEGGDSILAENIYSIQVQ